MALTIGPALTAWQSVDLTLVGQKSGQPVNLGTGGSQRYRLRTVDGETELQFRITVGAGATDPGGGTLQVLLPVSAPAGYEALGTGLLQVSGAGTWAMIPYINPATSVLAFRVPMSPTNPTLSSLRAWDGTTTDATSAPLLGAGKTILTQHSYIAGRITIPLK